MRSPEFNHQIGQVFHKGYEAKYTAAAGLTNDLNRRSNSRIIWVGLAGSFLAAMIVSGISMFF